MISKFFSLRNWVMKQLMKQNKEGIMKIPEKGKIDFGEMILKESLFEKGIDPKLIKNEDQLNNILNTPAVPKSERVKPKKSADIIEVDFDKGRWNKSGGGKATESWTDKLTRWGGGPSVLAGELGIEGLNQIYQLLNMPGLYNKGGRAGLSYLLAEDSNQRIPLGGGGSGKPPINFYADFSGSGGGKQENYLGVPGLNEGGYNYGGTLAADTTFPFLGGDLSVGGELGIGRDKSDVDYKGQPIDWLSNVGEKKLGDDWNVGFKWRKKFAGGGMGRRAFLKLMAAVGATGAAAKYGLASLLKGGATKKVAQELTQVPLKNIKGMPAWFKPLVNKIIKEGTEIDSGAERVIIHKTKLPNSKTDVYVNQHLDSGDVTVDIGVDKHGFGDGHLGQPVRLNYKASEWVEPTINTKTKKVIHKGQKTKDEFWVEEAEFTGGHPENIKFEETSFEKFGEHGSNFDEVEKFATGKIKKKTAKESLKSRASTLGSRRGLMKIKDYNDAIEFFRTSDLQAADGAWSEFYESEVLEPRNMDLAEGGRIPFGEGGNFETWLKDQIGKENTTFRTKGEIFDKAGAKTHGSNQRILDRYINQFTITSGSRLGGDVATKNKAIKNFLDTIDVGEKINVDQSVKIINKNLPKNEQISATGLRTRLKDTKLNTRAIGTQTLGQYHGELSDAMKSHIEEAFHDQGIDFKKGKYWIKSGGRGESKALYESIRRFVEGGKWNAAYNVGAADGWLLESFGRSGYKPLKEVIKGVEKTIGYEAPDGTKWFGAKKYATKYNGKQVKEFHPSWKRVNKLVNIVGETRVAPSQAIIDLLAKGNIKNIDGLTLERLANYLIDETDVKTTKSAFHKHHVKGVGLSPDEAIQLVTREANKIAEDARKAIKLDPASAATWDTKLKDMGIKVDVGGKSYGGKGFESKADIEKWATKKLGTWKTADFEKFAKQFIKDDLKFSSFPANMGAMWKAMGSGGRKALGLSTGLLTEFIFMGLDMKNEMSKGKSAEEAASIAKRNASFGMYNDGGYLKELKKVAEDMDIDTQAFDKVFAMNERMFKVGQQQDYYQAKIDKLKTMGPKGIEEAEKMQQVYDKWQSSIDAENEKLIEGIAGQVAISKAGEVFPNPNLDQIAKARYTLTNDDFSKVFGNVQEAGIEKLRREKKSAFDVQSKQANPEAGSTFNWLTNFFTGTENFFDWRTKGEEEQRLIDEMGEFSPQELYRYNLARGVDPDNPLTQESFENLIYQQPGLGFSGAEGGIASLKKKW